MSSTSSAKAVAAVVRIPVVDLVHGANARGELGDVAELAHSLRTLGQQQPVLVEPGEDGKWTVWDGNRRLKAARAAGMDWLLAIPRKTPLTETQRVLRQLGMHSTGKSFDPLAEARAIEHLMFADAGPHMAREEIARALSKSPAWVKGRVDLLQLTAGEQDAVVQGNLSVSAALVAVAGRRGGPGQPRQRDNELRCNERSGCGCVCHKRNRTGS